MDRYQQTFSRLKKEHRIGFCPFAVLGDPTEKECLKRIQIYLDANPDFLELGIPFSDPIADGPVIQAADTRAIENGMTPKKAIQLIKKIRIMADKNLPIGILTYSNIVFKYGIHAFYHDLKKAGADSVLIADVPLEEIHPFAKASKKYGIHQIFLVSEYTDMARLRKIEKIASGFLYVVSTLGVTGSRGKLQSGTPHVIRRLKKLTSLPLVVGFGISKREHIEHLQKVGANGAIVGSALVMQKTRLLRPLLRFLQRR